VKPEDREAFARIVLGFAELKGRALSKPAVDLFWSAMQGWTIEEFRGAAEHLLRTLPYFPTPHDFEQLRKARLPKPGDAFAQAVAHAASGEWRTRGCGDDLVDRAVRALGGYVVVALCDQDKLPFLERRFAEHYAGMSDAEAVVDALPNLSTWRPKLRGPRPAGALVNQVLGRKS
jgi:hypothetical protein